MTRDPPAARCACGHRPHAGPDGGGACFAMVEWDDEPDLRNAYAPCPCRRHRAGGERDGPACAGEEVHATWTA